MRLEEYVGQEGTKNNLELILDAAKLGRKVPHILITGSAGIGKTLLASIIAEELDAEYIYINGSAITNSVVFRKPIKDAIKHSGMDKRYIIAVDEAHALPKKIQNTLLSVLEEPAILCTPVPKRVKVGDNIFLEKGEVLKEKLPDNVSFIFCTTDKSKLTDALISRLHNIYLEEYSIDECAIFLDNKLSKYGILIDDMSIALFANAAKNMRHLDKLSERIIDYSKIKKIFNITETVTYDILTILGIDKYGRDTLDKKYIEYLRDKDVVALSNIARFLNAEEHDIKEKIEPFLIRRDWIEITQRGRKLTQTAKTMFFGEVNQKDLGDLMTELELA